MDCRVRSRGLVNRSGHWSIDQPAGQPSIFRITVQGFSVRVFYSFMQFSNRPSSYVRAAAPGTGCRQACSERSRCRALPRTRQQPRPHVSPAIRNVLARSSGSPRANTEDEDIQYVDTWSDVQFINICRRAYGGLAGWQSPRNWKEGHETYQGMIDVSRALMKVTSTLA